MELVTLNAQNQPDKLIEDYDSLIWTERYSTLGDFQLVSGDVSGTLSKLPEGKVVSLRESNVPMIVETQLIERKKNQPQKVTIKGRTFDSVLQRRVALASVTAGAGSSDWIVNAKTPSDVAWYIINEICVVGRLDVADIFPAATVVFPAPSDYGTSTGPSKNFTVPRGNLLNAVLGLLQTAAGADLGTAPVTPEVVPHGIRAVRPAAGSTAISVQIYTGTDKRDQVYFDATRDLLDDGSYLFSKVDSANAAYGLTQGLAAKMHEGAVAPTGMNRRVIIIDGSTSVVTDLNVLKSHMSQSLSEARETAMFDGSINQGLSPYLYGVDYNLGDIVKVVGDYDLDNLSRVTEYIRSEDATGDKAYPTLTRIEGET